MCLKYFVFRTGRKYTKNLQTQTLFRFFLAKKKKNKQQRFTKRTSAAVSVIVIF